MCSPAQRRDGDVRALPVTCQFVSLIRHQAIAQTVTQSWGGGEGIDRHRHDEHQLVYVSTGVLAVGTERGSWVASRDRAVWVPAGVWHEHRFHGPTSLHTLGFTVNDAPLAAAAPAVLAVTALARELIIIAADPELPEPEAQRLRAVLRDQLQRSSTQPLVLPTAQDDRLATACLVVESDLSRPRTMSSLAHQTGTSERTLARLFRTEFGTTYPQWRTTLRVYHAMIRLSAGATVTETAHRCGWATPSAFIDTFTRTLGQTPGSYRTRR